MSDLRQYRDRQKTEKIRSMTKKRSLEIFGAKIEIFPKKVNRHFGPRNILAYDIPSEAVN